MNRRMMVRAGWDEAGRKGVVVAQVFVEQWWAVIVWDGQEDPDCFKFRGLVPDPDGERVQEEKG